MLRGFEACVRPEEGELEVWTEGLRLRVLPSHLLKPFPDLFRVSSARNALHHFLGQIFNLSGSTVLGDKRPPELDED